MKKFVCSVCGYVFEGEAAPEKCPVCGVGADKFVEQKEDEMSWKQLTKKQNMQQNSLNYQVKL